MAKPGSIFISYRRSDSIAEAGRIYDKLVEAFGAERIFKDVDNIPYGADFVAYLDQAVAQCDVLMPLIGKTWLNVTDAEGKRRLDDPHDFVRIEIAAALKRDILVLPVLLDGAVMPGPADLPEDLQTLARRNAARVRHDPDFHSDMRRIAEKLREYFASRGIDGSESPKTATAVAFDSTSKSTKAKTSNFIIPGVLSGVTGLISLVDWFQFYELPSLLSALGLLVAAVLLCVRQRWGWGVAIAAQVFAIVLCGQAIAEIFADSEYGSPALYEFLMPVSISLLALITLGLLLLPSIRRGSQ